MRVLVSGAAGFIGRPLCHSLSDLGYVVLGASRKVYVSSRKNVIPLRVGDTLSETDWTSALTDVDAVIHLAARTHVMRETAADPLAEYRKVNVAGTERLASEAAREGVRRFIFLSSIKVNGEATFDRPFTEMDAPNPNDAYGISKREAEQALHRIASGTGMEIVILRPPLVYGPGVKGNFLSLLKAVQRGIPLPLGSIENKRSLIYVGNLVDAIILCISHPNAAGQTFLVSDGEDISTPELIKCTAAALNRRARIVSFPLSLLRLAAATIGRNDAIDRLSGSLQIDASRIRRELEWRPPYSVAAGLAATGEWHQGLTGHSDQARMAR